MSKIRSIMEKPIIDTLGLLAVVVSLVFVGLEIRQNNNLARATAFQNIGIATADALRAVSNDPVLAAIISQPLEALNRTERQQLRSWYMAWLRLLETLMLQVEQGLLPPDAVERLGYSIWDDYRLDPRFVCLWPEMRAAIGQSAREYIERDGLPQLDCPPPR